MTDLRWTLVLGLLALAGACKGEAPAGSSELEPRAVEGAPTEAADARPGEPAKAAKPAKVDAPPAEPLTGHAVARAGSLVFLASTGDVGFELPPLGSAPGMTVDVVGEQDGRLVVETLVGAPSPEHHCAATLDGLSDFRLRLYLAESELLPVLTEGFVHEVGDGTTIRLARGVPVPAGATEVLVRGAAVRVPVPAERLGRAYEPAQPFAREGSDGLLEPLEGHPLTYGGQTLAEERLYQQGDKLLRFGATERTGDALVTVRNPCLEVVAQVSTARLHATAPGSLPPGGTLGMVAMESSHTLALPYGGAIVGGGGAGDEEIWGGLGVVGTGATEKAYEVKAGAAILWADGRPAGQVTADHEFDGPPRNEGGRTCFDAPLVEGQATTLTLCFAPADVGEIEKPASLGTLGLGSGMIGLGSGSSLGSGSGVGTGSGFGTGRGFGGRGKKVPHVRQAKPKVAGSLDKDIIRRIVRAHINEVRYCYNQGLARDPSLAGTVSIQFTISPMGSVPVATVAKSSLKDSSVDECIAKAVKRWVFPKPSGGGAVVVTYPFVLEPGE